MKSRGRCRRRTGDRPVDGLIAFSVVKSCRDVRRQRGIAKIVEVAIRVILESQPHFSSAEILLDHRARNARGLALRRKLELHPWTKTLGRPCQGAPLTLFLSQQEDLDRPPSRQSNAAQSGGDDPAVVGSQEIAGRQPPPEVGNRRMVDRAGRSIEDQEPRRVAILQRRLCDQLRREVVVEIGGSQRHRAYTIVVRPHYRFAPPKRSGCCDGGAGASSPRCA
jgi:hypothetical protein